MWLYTADPALATGPNILRQHAAWARRWCNERSDWSMEVRTSRILTLEVYDQPRW